MDRVDCTVIGAGVVGLACARALALAGHEVVILEREGAIGTGISSRHSEVIHAGLYYPTGSLKATLCVRGNALMYDYCAARGIAHRRCGKLVVATDQAETGALEGIASQSRANGVPDGRLIDGAAAHTLEPALHAAAAYVSPSSGIVDSHGLMLAMLGDAQAAGAALALASPFASASRHDGQWRLCTAGGYAMATRWIVNAAGLSAPTLARSIEGFPPAAIPTARFAKGHYFSLAARAPFSRLIYPIPVPGGLGVHLTLDLGGQARFGPDVEWLDNGDEREIDYAVDASRAPAFEAEIRRYWPALPSRALQPAYSGVRPKICAREAAAADFRIEGPEAHGAHGIVQLFGIESPGLTASLAIGERVAAIVAAAER